MLDLSDTQVRDLTPLSQLRSLRELKLTNSKVVDLSPLQSLPHLSRLHLAGMAIEDAELLSDFPQLRNVSVTPSLLSPDIMAQLKTVFPDLAMSSADYVMLTRSLPPTQAKLAQ